MHLSGAMFAWELGGEELDCLREYNIVPALDPAFIKRGRALFLYFKSTVFGYIRADEPWLSPYFTPPEITNHQLRWE